MEKYQMMSYFSREHKINLIEGRGDFAVSPDKGDIRRIFLADIKKRYAGRMLLGVIGIQIFSEELGGFLELSAYITNFDKFMNPPIIQENTVAMEWIDLIANELLDVPIAVEDIIRDLKVGKIRGLPVLPFVESSVNSGKFYEKLIAYSE